MTGTLQKSVSYGRKTIVFGLPWFTAEEEEQPRKAAAALVKKTMESYDLAVLRRGEFQQYALASSADGARSGSLAGAAIVAELAGLDSWLFVMEIGEDIWICAGRDGYILADGDAIFDNQDKAQEAFRRLNPASFKKVYLPRSWREHRQSALEGVADDIEETDIRDFLSYDTPKWAKIQSLSSTGALVKTLAGLLVLGALGMGAMVFLGNETVPDDPDAAVRALREIQERERRALADAYAELNGEQPWAVAPLAVDALRSCLDAMGAMPITPVGYKISTITCSGSMIEAEVDRTTGYSTWLREWAQGYSGLEIDIDPSGTTGMVYREIAPAPARGPGLLQDNHAFDTVSTAIFERAQIEGAGVTMTPPTIAVYPDYPDYKPKFATGTFEITTKRPLVWLESFSEFSGFALNSVSYGLDDQNYRMEGKLYVPNL